jgi:hypothetical protein
MAEPYRSETRVARGVSLKAAHILRDMLGKTNKKPMLVQEFEV